MAAAARDRGSSGRGGALSAPAISGDHDARTAAVTRAPSPRARPPRLPLCRLNFACQELATMVGACAKFLLWLVGSHDALQQFCRMLFDANA